MITLAITGGIGTGKTYIATLFGRAGIPVFHADAEAKKLYARPDVLQQVRQTFGEGVFEGDTLSLSNLTKVIFSDRQALEKINGIIHPLVLQEFEKWSTAQSSSIVMMESALVFEGGMEHYFDYIITVDASLERRLQRLRLRDSHLDEATLLRKIDAQWPQQLKCRRADFVIHHDHDNEDELLQQQVHDIIHHIKKHTICATQ